MRNRYLQFSISAALITALSTPIASAIELEEIFVTAKKRSQNLQDVAGSIQAINSGDLAKSQINGFDDYVRMIPSLNALNSGGGQAQISMRGVFSARLNHAQPQVRSTSGLYLEDIPITTSAFNPDAGLVDIERIEVLRGPQGTLYGASAMSGAIRIIPVAPNLDTFEGEFSVSASTIDDGGDNYSVKGILNVPISDNFALRTNAYSNTNGGYIDNVFSGEDDYNEEESYGGRLTALWEVSDAVSITGLVLYHNLEADGRPDEYVPGNPLNSIGGNGGGSLVASPFESAQQFSITDERQISKVVDDPFDDEYYIVGLTVDVDLGWGVLTSVTSYFDREFYNELDDSQRIRDQLGPYSAQCYEPGGGVDTSAAGCEPVVVLFKNDSESDQFTQELRINWDGDTVQWVAGIFYSDQTRELNQIEPLNTVSGQPALEALATAFGFGGIDFGGTNPNNVFEGSQTIDTEQIALFGEATFGLSDAFELVVGLRLFEYEQSADIFFAGIANDGATILKADTSESGVNPNLVLKYIVSDDVNVYASAAKGFRIGGLNDPIPLSGVFGTNCAANLAALGLNSLEESFESDELWNYEIGVKSVLADGRMRINSALFYIDWEDIQTQAFLPCGFQTLTNDASLVSQGVEFELLAQATEDLAVNVGFSYTDSSLNGDSVILAATDGNRTPYTPAWLASAGFDYILPFDFPEAEFYLRADVQYTSESFSEFSEAAPVSREKLDSHLSANMYLGVTMNSWEAAVFAKNLTDERIVTGYDADRRQPSTFSIARPRTLGVNVKYLF